MSKTKFLITALFALNLAACDDDLTKTCKKLADQAAGEELPKKMKEEMNVETCKTKLTEMKEQDPEATKKLVACIEGTSDFKGSLDCMMSSAKPK